MPWRRGRALAASVRLAVAPLASAGDARDEPGPEAILATVPELLRHADPHAAAASVRGPGPPPVAPSAAHGLVGAHALACGDVDGAVASFARATDASGEAKDVDGELVTVGSTALAKSLAHAEDGAAMLAAALYRLRERGTEDAALCADQIEPARSALGAWLARPR